jgi:hypothetical protein
MDPFMIKGVFVINAILSVAWLNLSQQSEVIEKPVYIYSTYWGTWSEVIDIVDGGLSGKVWVEREIDTGRKIAHETKQDVSFTTTRKPPKGQMNYKTAYDFCLPDNKEAVGILRKQGLTFTMTTKSKYRTWAKSRGK